MPRTPRGQITETQVRPGAIVLMAPLLDLAPRIGKREEHLLIEALLAQATVGRLDECVLDRLARRDKPRRGNSRLPCQARAVPQGMARQPRAQPRKARLAGDAQRLVTVCGSDIQSRM